MLTEFTVNYGGTPFYLAEFPVPALYLIPD